MKKLKLAALVAGMAASGLVTVANAGQIQASATSYAREAIRADSQAVKLPVVGYKLFGSVDARSQVQQFSVELVINAGAFATAPAVTDVYLQDQNLNTFLVTPQSVSLSGNKITAVFNIPNVGGGGLQPRFYPNPIIIINEVSGVATPSTYGTSSSGLGTVGAATVRNLYTNLAQFTQDCEVGARFVSATFTHKDSAGQVDDSARTGSTNTANVLALNTTHYVDVKPNTIAGALNPAVGNQSFVAGGNGGGMVAGGTGTGALSSTLVNLGRFDVVGAGGNGAGALARDNIAAGTAVNAGIAAGFDTDGANYYSIEQGQASGGASPNLGGYYATTVSSDGFADGRYETGRVTAVVSAPEGLVAGGSLFLSSNAICSAPVSNIFGAAGGETSATLVMDPVPSPGWQFAGNVGTFGGVSYSGAPLGPRAHVCYSVPGTSPVPASSFSARVQIEKASGAGGDQNNVCSGPLYGFGGAIKIDVRNYIPAAVTAANNWMSVIRLINTSDTFNAVRVFGQTIYADGRIGNSAQLATLRAREAVYMLNSEIDALLAAGAAPASSVAGNNLAGVGTNIPGAARTGPLPNQSISLSNNVRLRITAEGGNTLRVQNYLFNLGTGQMVEASSSQGVDFAGTTNRAPLSEGQYQDQDAQSGINLR